MEVLILAISLMLSPGGFAAEAAPNEAKPPQRGAGVDFSPQEDPALERFTARRWSKGLHLFAGLGLNTALYKFSDRQRDLAWGLGITSAIGYVLNRDWMLEMTSSLGFRRVEDFFLWDSFFAPGARLRLGGLGLTTESSFYVRGFTGWGMEVLLPHRVPERTHLSGPVAGAGFGLLNGKAKESVWFVDFVTYAHVFRKRNVVKPEGDVPKIVSRTRINDRVGFALGLSVGILVF